MTRTIGRRTFLRGAGGALVALPWLDAMMPSGAKAQPASTRYLVAFGGTSLGHPIGGVAPTTAGALSATRGLRPLAGRTADARYEWDSLLSDFGVVSGLRIPWSGEPGSRGRIFHVGTPGPLLSGAKSPDYGVDCRGPSSDEIVANAIGGDHRFRAIHYRVQPDRYRTTYQYNRGFMSYRRTGSGSMEPNTPIASPRVAYDQLFQGFVPPGETVDPRVANRLADDRSVLDLVRESASRLLTRLGSADRQRIERHFEEIRALEREIADTPIPTQRPACQLLPDPGNDPSIASAGTTENGNIGYSGEDRRAKLMCDLIYMAFACDQTRVATLLMTYAMSFMSAETIVGKPADIHDLGHHKAGGTREDMDTIYAWHVKHLAYLADKLRGTPDGDGTLLDRTAIVFLTEGGRGHDPELNQSDSPHSTENMVVLVGGHAGGLRTGHHIVAANRHPAEVLITAMNAVGVPTTRLNEIEGGISGLL